MTRQIRATLLRVTTDVDRPDDQRNEVFDTPMIDEIVGRAPRHAAAMERSDDPAVWSGMGMNYVLLTMVGRRSGETRKTPVPYWVDENGCRVVAASLAGSESHPAWFHNLADRDANATIRVRERAEEFDARADVLDGGDRERVWDQLTTDRPFYLDYQAKTERLIPLIRLVPIS